MKKKVFGRRFKRDKNERKALFRSLVTSLVIKGRIETTEEKAKSIKAEVDRMITLAKKGGERSKNLLPSFVYPNGLEKLTLEIAPSFKNRAGGYTRIIRKGKRLTDSASMVVMEWVEGEKVDLPKKAEKKEKPRAKKTPVKAKTVKKETKNAKK